MPAFNEIIIYTDGSCNARQGIGAWAAIVVLDEKQVTLQGKADTTSHQQMELEAVIQSLNYVERNVTSFHLITICSDSQYVTDIPKRKERLRNLPDGDIRNANLVNILIRYLDKWNITFVKVKAHQKKTTESNLNREVDKLSRKIVRAAVKEKC